MIALGIIGWPLELTLSPKLHEYLFKITSLKGTYDKLPIKTIEHSKLKALLDEYVGLNVTSPHKEAVYRELVSLSKASESVKGSLPSITLFLNVSYIFIILLNSSALFLASSSDIA